MSMHTLSMEQARISVEEHRQACSDLLHDEEFRPFDIIGQFKWLEMPGLAGDFVFLPEVERVGQTLQSASREELLAMLPQQKPRRPSPVTESLRFGQAS